MTEESANAIVAGLPNLVDMVDTDDIDYYVYVQRIRETHQALQNKKAELAVLSSVVKTGQYPGVDAQIDNVIEVLGIRIQTDIDTIIESKIRRDSEIAIQDLCSEAHACYGADVCRILKASPPS